MPLLENLEKLGLDDKQAAVYLACLELGSGTIAEVSEKSGVKRTSIYNFLEEMKQKGLLTTLEERGRTIVVATDPNNLVSQKQKSFEAARSLLPDLMGIFNLPGNKPRVRFFSELKGIEAAYQDLLKTGEDIYGFSDYEEMFMTMDHEFLWNFPKERKKKKMKFFSIGKDGPRGRHVQSLDKEQLRETRLAKDVDFKTEINIYGNKVAMMSFHRPYSAVIIEDVAIAHTMRSIWKAWWGTLGAKKI